MSICLWTHNAANLRIYVYDNHNQFVGGLKPSQPIIINHPSSRVEKPLKKHVSVAKTIPCLPAMTGNGNEVYTNRKMLMTGGWCVHMRLWHWELPTGKYVTPPHLAWNLG
jgi:hypothetical protein